MLLRLAGMEDEHEQTFAGMHSGLSGAEKRPLTADPDNQAALYLRSMVDGKVFRHDPSEDILGHESIGEILTTAIGLEKDSIVLYESMKGVVSAAACAKLDAIIQEEIGHLLDLTKQLQAAG